MTIDRDEFLSAMHWLTVTQKPCWVKLSEQAVGAVLELQLNVISPQFRLAIGIKTFLSRASLPVRRYVRNRQKQTPLQPPDVKPAVLVEGVNRRVPGRRLLNLSEKSANLAASCQRARRQTARQEAC